MTIQQPSHWIQVLVTYALREGLAEELDRPVLTNSLHGILDIAPPPAPPADGNEMEAIYGLLDHLRQTGHPWGHLSPEACTGRIMSILTPSNSHVARTFREQLEDNGPEAATQWFYRFSGATKDVRLDLASRDLRWITQTIYGDLQISVNRSKPEKDPRDIAAPKSETGYPRCLLCPENAGFWSQPGHPERSNHRIVPLNLGGEPWFFQYSPYVYYHQHCIVFSKKHRPMVISPETVVRILDFLDIFPHFFLGSNAALPIVGGSILDHDHFQGGCWDFPIQKATVRRSWTTGNTTVEALHWPLTTIRLRTDDRSEMEALASVIIQTWQAYEDRESGIIPTSTKDGHIVRHNSLSIIGRKAQDAYEMDLALRNNRINEDHPHGVFHIRPERHHIKKENIGLMEVMGLAILPGRLLPGLEPIRAALMGCHDKLPPESPHTLWGQKLVKEHGHNLTEDQANSVLRQEIGTVFLKALQDCGVYEDNAPGWRHLDRFVDKILKGL
ncbi:MAG: galactose-1-phosphate uridylyltransferase [Dethiosulfovibrio peptidovorans]|nr:MAG: galactose-1-phosphate uridylyltransferase [Dethiosulfovibrio peptidovorans]